MIESPLFTIPMWSIPTLNFKTKKKQLTNLLSHIQKRKQVFNHSLQTDNQTEMV